MTDRELLELSAKACGYSVNPPQALTVAENLPTVFVLNGKEWNPLTDDGDALRLAVKLNIQVTGNTNGVGQAIWNAENPCGFAVINEDNKSNPYAATRRAIVRAAAEIGRAM